MDPTSTETSRALEDICNVPCLEPSQEKKKLSKTPPFSFFFASNRPTAWASSASSCACPRGEAAGLLSGWTGRGKSRRMYPTYEDLPAEVRKMIFVKRAQFRRERREAAIIIGRNVCFYFLGSRLCRLGRTHHLVQSATPYMRNWARRRCVRNRHSFILDKPYGVVVICETCNVAQGFNWCG